MADPEYIELLTTALAEATENGRMHIDTLVDRAQNIKTRLEEKAAEERKKPFLYLKRDATVLLDNVNALLYHLERANGGAIYSHMKWFCEPIVAFQDETTADGRRQCAFVLSANARQQMVKAMEEWEPKPKREMMGE